MTVKKIVIVGGGAGGLALASKLGRRLGHKADFDICLVDKSPIHIWKPKLHEVAVGAIDKSIDGLLYRDHSLKNGYRFIRGEIENCDHSNNTFQLAPVYAADGELLLATRTIEYDFLVLALGSVSNTFGTKGADEHCILLDNLNSAELFHQKLLDALLQLSESADKKVSIGIVGAGATGVELAAELFHVIESVKEFGYVNVTQHHLDVHLLEASPKILPQLPEKVSARAQSLLDRIGIKLHIGVQVKEISKEGFITHDGNTVPADIKVWAAGVKGPDVFSQFTTLPVTKRNQIEVDSFMKAIGTENVFAIGDCAELKLADGSFVPPRAQAADQMAQQLYKNLIKRFTGRKQKPFEYRDYGSLVSLSRFSAVGNLMGSLRSGQFFVEGHLARVMYMSLYQRHLSSLFGWFSAIIYRMAKKMLRWHRPKLKLH
ncbi:NAD(P)/FAD-dependent oxidoreductase [Parashewanella spongiae]|uniref:NAD(P)/FAD-dependent oxidoreductase n=1 Tax=Parashewanella spongiae TaxID=342950 RepID=A0A3A6TG60_9GAMM|nr:NAD(P)/FAD-dependent oxidoreductase [Parashewanella spongiae]MCL1079512.1 NAD(P)/FAD-dependent oxidoreductase [Parashewanella spongiae]RJY07502.1 NAD(P)/FAD-dependent oxidoreductase [Parashewanella spongiae]